MKKINSFLFITSNFLLLTSLFLFGCHSKQSPPQTSLADSNNFPPELVGAWKADEAGWQFTFNDLGQITKAIMEEGYFELDPTQKIIVTKNKLNSTVMFVFDSFDVLYNPQTRELAIEIIISNYKVTASDGSVFEGNSEDYIMGTLSEDFTQWDAIWTKTAHYVITGEGKSEEINIEPNDWLQNLIFKKVQ